MCTLLCWHAYDVMFMGCDSYFGTQKNYATTTILRKALSFDGIQELREHVEERERCIAAYHRNVLKKTDGS